MAQHFLRHYHRYFGVFLLALKPKQRVRFSTLALNLRLAKRLFASICAQNLNLAIKAKFRPKKPKFKHFCYNLAKVCDEKRVF